MLEEEREENSEVFQEELNDKEDKENDKK